MQLPKHRVPYGASCPHLNLAVQAGLQQHGSAWLKSIVPGSTSIPQWVFAFAQHWWVRHSEVHVPGKLLSSRGPGGRIWMGRSATMNTRHFCMTPARQGSSSPLMFTSAPADIRSAARNNDAIM
eukprot:scaffold120026_cov41-Prasinocladus_malaysianus.AAC.1